MVNVCVWGWYGQLLSCFLVHHIVGNPVIRIAFTSWVVPGGVHVSREKDLLINRVIKFVESGLCVQINIDL